MKKIFLVVFVFFAVNKGYSQQIPLTSQYMFNSLVINPAVAGIKEDDIIVRLQNRNQWVGLKGAPVTQLASIHTFVDRLNIGMGAYFFNDVVGPSRQTGLQTSYSYHINISAESKISLGLQAGVFQYNINTTGLTTDQENDQAINKAAESHILPDAAFGALYYSSKYYAGFSVPHLIGGTVGDSQFKLNRHYQLMGGALLQVSDEIQLQPSVLVRFVEPVPLSVDLSARAIFKEIFWLGATYRTNDAFVILAGLRMADKLFFGYSFDFTTSSLSAYSKGSHELMLGIDLGKKGRKSNNRYTYSSPFLL